MTVTYSLAWKICCKKKKKVPSGKGLDDFETSRNRNPQTRRKLVEKLEMELRSLDSQVSAHVSTSKRICSEAILSNYSCCWIQGGPCQYIRSLCMKRQFFLRLNKKGREFPLCALANCSMLKPEKQQPLKPCCLCIHPVSNSTYFQHSKNAKLSSHSLLNLLLLPMETFQEQGG